jgi:hypothetical protein
MMNKDERGKVLGWLAGLVAGLNPMRSATFLLALSITTVAAWKWMNRAGDPPLPFPFYGVIAASYAGGFLIGRVFWRLVKTAAIVAAIVLGGLAVLNRMHVDTTKAKEDAEAGSMWARNEASRAKHYLMHWLPSGGAAGVGAFAGSRRRGGDVGKDRNTATNPEI